MQTRKNRHREKAEKVLVSQNEPKHSEDTRRPETRIGGKSYVSQTTQRKTRPVTGTHESHEPALAQDTGPHKTDQETRPHKTEAATRPICTRNRTAQDGTGSTIERGRPGEIMTQASAATRQIRRNTRRGNALQNKTEQYPQTSAAGRARS